MPTATEKRFRLKIKWRTALLALLISPLAAIIANRIWPLPLNDVQMARVVVAEEGTPLWRFADKEGVWRYPVTLEQVSPYYLQALLAYEDRWFYQHRGINPLAIARAAWQNLTHGRIISGGSTLTMQVARLLEPHNRTLGGKLRQLWRTLQLEWYLSKEQILTLYLNRAPFGGTLQGIGAASWAYLGKPPSGLTRSEAVLMAVLPQAPSRLRPDRYPERARQARDKVLDRLAKYQLWKPQEIKDIREESIYLAPRQSPQMAPLLARRLAQQYRGDVLHTTINLSLQRRLEEMALGWKNQLSARTSLAVLVVDHSDMAVKAYLGSADFNDAQRFGQVDMISAIRSPGSTLKPFIYALALDDGLIHSESLLQDVPRYFSHYRPANFDSDFSGPVSAAEALVKSLNLPVVQLLEAYGPKRFSARLRNAGVMLNFPYRSEPNLALILGGTGMRMDQLVAGYSVFARQGKVAGLRYLQEQPLVERPLVSHGAAWIIRRLLSGETRPQGDEMLSSVAPFAWKTGTSYGYRDAWAVGISQRYLIGIWVGRPDSTPVVGQFGYATAVPILQQVNSVLEAQQSRLNLPLLPDRRPPGVSRATICWPQGQPLEEGDKKNCRQRRQAWVLDNITPPTLPDPDQDANGGWLNYWTNAQGEQVAADCPGALPQRLALWPIALESWLPVAERRESRLPPVSKVCPPTGFQHLLPLLILGVNNQSILHALPGEKQLELPLHAQGGAGQRWWFLNGRLVGESRGTGEITLTLSIKGRYQLVVMDESGQIGQMAFDYL